MSKTVFFDQSLIYDGEVSKSGAIVVTKYATGKYEPITPIQLLWSALTMLDGVTTSVEATGTLEKYKTVSGLSLDEVSDLLLEIAENHENR